MCQRRRPATAFPRRRSEWTTAGPSGRGCSPPSGKGARSSRRRATGPRPSGTCRPTPWPRSASSARSGSRRPRSSAARRSTRSTSATCSRSSRYTDGATAWAVMVGNGGTGTAGGWLPDAGRAPGLRRWSRPPAAARRGDAGAARHRTAGGRRVPGQRAVVLRQRLRPCRLADRRLPVGRPRRPADGGDRARRAGHGHRQLAGGRAARQRQLRLPARRGLRARGADVRAGRERLPGRRPVQRGSARVPVQRAAAADDRHGPPRARRDGRPGRPDGPVSRRPSGGGPPGLPRGTRPGARPGCGRPGRRTGMRSRRPGRPPSRARCRRACTRT